MHAQSRSGKKSFFASIPYGWWVLAVVFVIFFLDYGVRYSFGVFFKPLASEFGWSHAETSLVFSVHMAVYSISALAWGWASDRINSRYVVAAGCAGAGVCIALMYSCRSVTQAFLFFSIFTAVGMGGIYVPAISTVGKAFRHRRGFALGIVSTAVGLSYLWSPIAEWLISDYGWRIAYLVSGILLAGIGAPLSWRVLGRDNQFEQLGESPDTKYPTKPVDSSHLVKHQSQMWSIPMGLLNIMFMCALFALYVVTTHIAPYASDRGVNPATAAMALAFIGIFSIIGRFGIGSISDRIGRGRIFVISFVFQMAGLAAFLLIPYRPVLLFFLGAILLGIGYGSWVPQFPAAIADIFGLRNLGKLVGINTFFGTMFGATLGPWIGGYLHDVTGTYTIAFALAFAVTGVGLLVSLFVFRYLRVNTWLD